MARVSGVSVGADGTVWCVTPDGRLHRRAGSGWQMNNDASNVVEVAVGSNSVVWCRNREGGLFRAITPTNFNTQWQSVQYEGTGLRSISAAADGAIWAINSLGHILGWSGHSLVTFGPSSFQNGALIAGGGRGRLLFADVNGLLYERTSVRPGITFMRVPNPGESGVQAPVRSVSYGWNDDVWVASFSEGLFKRSIPGGIWRQNLRGQAVQISTGGGSWVWCLNNLGELFSAETNRFDTGWLPVTGPASGSGVRLYVVQPGDTLSAISRRFCPNLSPAALNSFVAATAQLNGLADANAIEVGQTLLIPPCP